MASVGLMDVARRGWRKKGEHLSTAERKAMPDRDFAMPGHGSGPEGKGSGSYPIPDAPHARNALAMVARYGSPSEKARVKAAVHRKYPEIGRSDKADRRYGKGGH